MRPHLYVVMADTATAIADSMTCAAAEIRSGGREFTAAQVADILTEMAAITMVNAEKCRHMADHDSPPESVTPRDES